VLAKVSQLSEKIVLSLKLILIITAQLELSVIFEAPECLPEPSLQLQAAQELSNPLLNIEAIKRTKVAPLASLSPGMDGSRGMRCLL